MAYSTNENLFWKLLKSKSVLVIDNDCCYVQHDYDPEEDEYNDSTYFGFGPKDLVFMFGEKLNIDMENC